MRALAKLRLRLRSLLQRSRVEAELAAELRFHLDQLVAENLAAGMSPREARHEAFRAFGGLTQIQERCRDMRGNRWIEELLQDISYALRTFRRSPVFTLVAALSLALGIGANTAIFSLIDALLLRSLPVRDPGRLVAVGDPARVSSLSSGNVRNDLFSYPLFEEIRRHNRVFTDVFASGRTNRLAVGVEPGTAATESARGRLVSGNYFSVLGVNAFRGRTFNAREDRVAGAAPFVVLSHDYWRRRFAGDSQAIGRSITLNGQPFTIIGVTPPGFFGDIVGVPTDLWIPLSMQPQTNPGRMYLDRWDVSWLLLMGRLKPGVTLQQARSEVNDLYRRLLAEGAGSRFNRDWLPGPDRMRVDVTPGGAGFSRLRREFSQPLFTLMGIVALVLVVACANVANLQLERATVRHKEIAVRLALGAGRPRLIRQLLTESVLLAAAGGLLGLLFAFWAGLALLRLVGAEASTALDIHPDGQVLAFTAGVSLLTGILFGLAPALRATRVELAPTLKESARSVVGDGSGSRWPLAKLLVVAQFAVSLLLLMGAGLFVRTLQNLQRLDLGFPRESLLLVNVDPVGAGYQGTRLATFPPELVERLQAVPGVSAATYSENGIFSGTESATSVRVEGFKSPPEGDPNLNFDRVGAGYFQTVGIPLLFGRDFGSQDGVGAPRVAVVNEAMAKQYFGTRSPLGKRLLLTGPPDFEYQIVGVARDARDHDLRGAVPPRFYIPLLQSEDLDEVAPNFVIRGREPAALVTPIRRAIEAYDPNLPTRGLEPLSAMIDDSIANERVIARLSSVFGLLALLLAALGLYGVISYTIARRINEIGIRMALGARRGRVLWMVLGETLLLAVAGIALGVPAVLGSARVVSSRLFGLSPSDPATLTAAAGVLLLVALLAGMIPGSRATRVEPVRALRYE